MGRGSHRPRGVLDRLAYRRPRCCLPHPLTVSAPSELKFRGSITLPARAPTDAWPPSSRTVTHGSGSRWCATPFSYDSFIRDVFSASLALQEVSSGNLGNAPGTRRLMEAEALTTRGLSTGCTNRFNRSGRPRRTSAP